MKSDQQCGTGSGLSGTEDIALVHDDTSGGAKIDATATMTVISAGTSARLCLLVPSGERGGSDAYIDTNRIIHVIEIPSVIPTQIGLGVQSNIRFTEQKRVEKKEKPESHE